MTGTIFCPRLAGARHNVLTQEFFLLYFAQSKFNLHPCGIHIYHLLLLYKLLLLPWTRHCAKAWKRWFKPYEIADSQPFDLQSQTFPVVQPNTRFHLILTVSVRRRYHLIHYLDSEEPWLREVMVFAYGLMASRLVESAVLFQIACAILHCALVLRSHICVFPKAWTISQCFSIGFIAVFCGGT